MQLLKPLAVAFKGKGPRTFFRRAWTIQRRYGLGAAKMDQALAALSHLLQQFDCRATLPITAVALARNGPLIQKYQAQGIEFAVHGYRHIDYSQLPLPEQLAHLHAADLVFKSQGIDYVGFRSPYLRGNKDTLTALNQTNFSYDSSSSLFWDITPRHLTDSYRRVLDFYGAKSASEQLCLPSFNSTNTLIRIPYCLPDDESLIERLQWQSPAEMQQVWPAMFHYTYDQGELFNLGLHPERTRACSDALKNILQAVQAVKSTVWRATLREIAAWWQERYAASLQIDETGNNLWQLTVQGPPGTTLLLRSIEAKTTVAPWFDGYQQAMETPGLILPPAKRPFVGVSPTTAPQLVSFLKQQGYIVEVSADPSLYWLYVDRPTFSSSEQRSLLVQIEESDFPLIRFGRWPAGARSALCITGDIDALTLRDYGLRFLGN